MRTLLVGVLDALLRLMHQLRRQVLEESRRRVVAALAHEGAPEGAHEVEAVLGTRDADVGEAALLLHLRRVVEAADVGQQAFLHADDEDDGELEALGGVQRDQCDGLDALVVFVGV